LFERVLGAQHAAGRGLEIEADGAVGDETDVSPSSSVIVVAGVSSQGANEIDVAADRCQRAAVAVDVIAVDVPANVRVSTGAGAERSSCQCADGLGP
jgi:hypothetical protein